MAWIAHMFPQPSALFITTTEAMAWCWLICRCVSSICKPRNCISRQRLLCLMKYHISTSNMNAHYKALLYHKLRDKSGMTQHKPEVPRCYFHMGPSTSIEQQDCSPRQTKDWHARGVCALMIQAAHRLQYSCLHWGTELPTAHIQHFLEKLGKLYLISLSGMTR